MPDYHLYFNLRDKIFLRFLALAFAIPMLCLILVSLTMLGCTNNKSSEFSLNRNLIVGMSLDYPPFEAKQNEQAYGFDVDLAHHIANKMGKKLIIREISFNNITEALKNSDIDMAISAISQDSIQDPAIKFSNCYITEGLALLSSTKNKKYAQNFEDFSKKGKIISIENTSIHRFIEQYQKRHNVKLDTLYFPNIYAALTYMEQNGDSGAILVDNHVALDIIRKQNYKFFMQTLHSFGYDNYAIAMPQNSPMLEEVNEILLELLADGVIDNLRAKWLR